MIAAYLDELVARLVREVGDELVGVWQFGSGALGDFDPRRSDIDVQAVTLHRLPRAVRERVAAALSHPALPCPVRGLEFVLYAREDLARSAHQLNLNTGPRMTKHASFSADEDPRFWFVIDASIGRRHGKPLLGPAAAEVFPALARAHVAASLLEALAWWAGEGGSPAQTLLAACRGWAWSVDGTWLSKAGAAQWAAARLGDPGPVARALAARADVRAPQPSAADVAAVVEPARTALRRRCATTSE